MGRKIKVLIVDDSALARKKLTEILNSDPEIEVISTAADPYIAVQKIKRNLPDVITLDLEMPRMNGLGFLKRIMEQRPMPVVVISSHAPEGSFKAMRAFELGALEVICKPKLMSGIDLREFQTIACDAVKASFRAKVSVFSGEKKSEKGLHKAAADRGLADKLKIRTKKLVVVGASTGGTVAIENFLTRLPENFPGIVIVQHMPPHFTYLFADRLDKKCNVQVKEAKNGDIVVPGCAFIAPGDQHVLVKFNGKHYYLEVKKGPLVNRHRPSVDVLFRSAARYVGKNAIGVIMTGMGDDGAKAMLEMKQAGAQTIAQDEESCVVFGMPREAIRLGAVDKVVPLDQMVEAVVSFL
ncbi:MAG: chemotaxis response regulator protein-glutamate methylesterase [Calditrichaeota bacterium]|nr:chemotaxis response regulator protein-glutamate methylesterase [Calditrichota bacterium]